MRNPFVHGIGGVLSADIAVPEHEREVDFYSKILTTGDAPLWRDDLMNSLGMPVIGLGAHAPEYDALPLKWMPHFQVADVAASAARAIDLGGKELMHGKNDVGQRQWSVLTDPDNAAFGIIPVVPKETDPTPHEIGQSNISSIAWLSLASPDASLSRDFYRAVIGWQSKSTEDAESEGLVARFEMLIDSETAAAEICQLGDEPNEVPSVWLIHLPVADLKESLRRVRECGGAVIKVFDEEGYVIIRDPVGVFLALRDCK